MSDAARGESPLLQQQPERRVVLRERSLLGYVIVRGRLDDSSFTAAVADACGGLELPRTPCTAVEGEGRVLCWMGPDEWMIITPPDEHHEPVSRLESQLAGVHAAVVDVTGGNTTISVSGSHAADVLAKGCPLDLHPRVFGPGACAQTHVAHASAMIRFIDDRPSFDIIVRRSFAEYLWLWLRDAAIEFGGT
jgi:sarcosine oxidase, subunit gamma